MERILTADSLIETLWRAANSPEARFRRDEYEEAKRSGKLVLKYLCSDARLQNLLGIPSQIISTIGAAEDPQNFSQLLRSLSSRLVIVMTHLNCGGQTAFATMTNEEGAVPIAPRRGIEKYIIEHIVDKDPVVVSHYQAKRIAKIVQDKPVLSSVADHVEGRVHIFGAFINRGEKVRPYSNIDFNDFNPDEVYNTSNDLLDVSLDNLPDDLAEEICILRGQNTVQIRRHERDNIDFHHKQEVQNPDLMYIGSSATPLTHRYPGTLVESPGSVFSIRTPKSHKKNGLVQVFGASACEQIEYVMWEHVKANSPANKGKTMPFRRTRLLLIETEDHNSDAIAKQLTSIPAFQRWSNNGGRVITAQIQSGQLVGMDEFKN